MSASVIQGSNMPEKNLTGLSNNGVYVGLGNQWSSYTKIDVSMRPSTYTCVEAPVSEKPMENLSTALPRRNAAVVPSRRPRDNQAMAPPITMLMVTGKPLARIDSTGRRLRNETPRHGAGQWI